MSEQKDMFNRIAMSCVASDGTNRRYPRYVGFEVTVVHVIDCPRFAYSAFGIGNRTLSETAAMYVCMAEVVSFECLLH